jgi:hypothetical protein
MISTVVSILSIEAKPSIDQILGIEAKLSIERILGIEATGRFRRLILSGMTASRWNVYWQIKNVVMSFLSC